MLSRTPLQSLIVPLLRRLFHHSRTVATNVPPLTTEQFPELQRGSYGHLTSEDLEVFKILLGSDRVITDPKELQEPNTDWMNTYRGVLQCQAGCILENLEGYANNHGFMIPLDLGAKGSCQIGGNVSTNAGGVRVIRYGSLHGSVLGLEVVLANGEVLDLMSCLKKDNTGYDLKQLFIGAEGTLGIITKVAIQCPTKPKSLSVAFLSCSSFQEVLATFRLAKTMLSEVLSSFEMMDNQSIEPLEKFYNIRPPIPLNNFYVLIEVTGSNEEHDQAKLNYFLEKVMDEGHVKDGTVATSLSAVKALWSIREQVTPALQLQGYVHKHDLSLPPHLYYKVVEVTRERLQSISSAICVGFGHLGDYNIHLNVIVKDSSQKPAVEEALYPFLYDWVVKQGGSISAEHGVGLKKKAALGCLKATTVLDSMKRIKITLDPSAILNPYKSIWSIREHVALAHFKEGKVYKYDISLPLNSYYKLVEDIRKRLNGRQAEVVGYGHLGDNNLHLTVVAPSYEEETHQLLEPFIYQWAKERKGSGSGEHGIGIMNKDALTYSKGSNAIALMKQIKVLYDSNTILNPYKVF